MKLSYISLKVFDLQRSIEFYERYIGLVLLERDENSASLGIDNKILLKINSSLDFYPSSEYHTGLYHFALLLPSEEDLSNYLQYIIDNQYQILGASDHLFSQAIYLNDPDGHGIEIYADRDKETWQYDRNGYLISASDPINLEQLLSKQNKQWVHVPKDTRLGHVHLQTNSIDESIDFYVNKLGFEIQTKVPSAVFISKNSYHHDLAFNTWNGQGLSPARLDQISMNYFAFTTDNLDYYKEIIEKEKDFLLESNEQYIELIDKAGIKSRIYKETKK